MKTIDIQIVQKPISVDWECPKCLNENSTKYNEFLDGIEYCDWTYSKVKCDNCGKEFGIDNINWD